MVFRFTALYFSLYLLVPGLTLPGALLTLGVAGQVFALNRTYDVPVKLFSAHLAVMSLRAAGAGRAPAARSDGVEQAGSRREPDSSRGRQVTRRTAVGLQLAAGAWVLGWNVVGVARFYHQVGAGVPRPPLYGIWNVEMLAVDGEVRTLLVTDSELLRRVVFPGPNTFVLQPMDDRLSYYGAKVDAQGRTIALTRRTSAMGGTPPEAAGRLTFEQPSEDKLVLDGTIEGSTVRMELKLFDHTKMQLLQSRFRWVQDYPFNR